MLSSGMHTSSFLDLEPIVEDPKVAAAAGAALADRTRNLHPQAVLTAGGVDAILGYETARQLGVRAIFTEGPIGRRVLRQGFSLSKGERLLIVMGVIITGNAAGELVRLATAHGSQAVGVAVLVDRSGGPLRLGIPVEALAVVDLDTYHAPLCPLCRDGVPLEKRFE